MLRNFLTDTDKEQVSVIDKLSGKTFSPNIHGVMSERRFNEFVIDDDHVASFEPAVCRIEEQVLPTYRDVVENRRLRGTMEERINLAFFMAFQLTRTKGQRETFKQLDAMVRTKFEKMGHDVTDELPENTDEELKVRHADFMRRSLKDFTAILSQKTFLLAAAAPNRSFYLGDNPIVLNKTKAKSDENDLFWGLGLGVLGVEVYLPLSKDLLLCAWCPSIRADLEAHYQKLRNEFDQMVVAEMLKGGIDIGGVAALRQKWEAQENHPKRILDAMDQGIPIHSEPTNMDLYNSLQMFSATRFVICPDGDYQLARQFIDENPHHQGRQLQSN
ncbi:DUF4238 domain-containing protein [Altererythrobacter sp. HHU K3-1]|uniref:DUF4238 domain-containing protein n=2 Tax=Qipengyuania atrilutea TaxID=2744473 RepID=A0A850GZ02_9SPHN|nr:DUF4238 domain-containing protein [Actirhodobacter atriluteus]